MVQHIGIQLESPPGQVIENHDEVGRGFATLRNSIEFGRFPIFDTINEYALTEFDADGCADLIRDLVRLHVRDVEQEQARDRAIELARRVAKARLPGLLLVFVGD